MSDLAAIIAPKSDQLNADDLLAGPRTITITSVTITPGEQPVAISYAGDNGRPWKPCKSMCRILVALWGPDASKYTGRSVTLYRDPSVRWGGMEVGGIRISHASHIERGLTMALTATRGQRKPFTVKPLQVEEPAAQPWPMIAPDGSRKDAPDAAKWIAWCKAAISKAATVADLDQWLAAMVPHFAALASADADAVETTKREASARRAQLMDAEA